MCRLADTICGQAEELLSRAEEHLDKSEWQPALATAKDGSKIFLKVFGSKHLGYAKCQHV